MVPLSHCRPLPCDGQTHEYCYSPPLKTESLLKGRETIVVARRLSQSALSTALWALHRKNGVPLSWILKRSLYT